MRHEHRHILLAIAAMGVLAVAGCGGGKTRATPASPPPATTNGPTVSAATPPSRCEQTVSSAIVDAGDAVDAGTLDALGLALPDACSSLAELRAALAAHDLEGLDRLVIQACVAGDTWANPGEPTFISETDLCHEARSTYSLAANRRLIRAQALYSEDFSGGCNGWNEEGSARVRMSCADGDYRIVVRKPGGAADTILPTDGRLKGISIEADATLVQPDRGSVELHGVTCWAVSGRLGYAFVLDPAGDYLIVKVDRSASRPTLVKQGSSDHALPGVGSRNRIRGECTGSSRGTSLALYVNGDRAAVARDRSGPATYVAYGLTVAAAEPGTEVRFDNVLVRVPPSRS